MIYDKFCWYTSPEQSASMTPAERYNHISEWAGRARGTNPGVFDELTGILLECGGLDEDGLAETEALFLRILNGFIRQNKLLHDELSDLEPAGVVNTAVFGTLERFDDELSGKTHAPFLREAVEAVFHDFGALRHPDIRKQFAGGMTGPAGTDSVAVFGYINVLKDCDASVQWTLFMPGLVSYQQQDSGIRVQHFEYKILPALRLIGAEKDLSQNPEALRNLLDTLDSLSGYRCGFDHDIIFIHHFGKGVDVEEGHGIWGRFFKADTPVPDGLEYVDLVPQNDHKQGIPYLSQFAFARFAGDVDSMLREEGFDGNAMYDITRNIILGQDVCIPYPDKYWTAEVYLDGFGSKSTAYLFSVEK